MELKFILEAILFSAQEPLSPKRLRDLLSETAELAEEARPYKKLSLEEITAALEQLSADHAQASRSYRLGCVAGNWQFFVEPPYAPWLRVLIGEKSRPARLSQPALETLAVVAYRQPITRAEIEQVRGVAVDGVVQTLLERELIAQAGRAEVIGRPMTYATTSKFLEYFGLRSIEELPAADELRRIVIKKPEALLTADEGLATPAPEQAEETPNPEIAPESPQTPEATPEQEMQPTAGHSPQGIPEESATSAQTLPQ